jgi:MFS family permease
MSDPSVSRTSRRDLRTISAALGLSALGDELALTALTIKAAQLYAQPGSGGEISYAGSSTAVAALLIAGVLPQVLLAPFGGWLVDRMESTRALRLASFAQAAIALALAFADGLPAILVLSFLLGAGATIAAPATFTLVPAIVGGGDTTKANSWMETSRYVGWVLGPIAAGSLAHVADVASALIVDSATFAVVAVVTWLLHARAPAEPEAARERPLREALAGLRAIRGDRILVAAIVVVSLTVVFAAMDNVAEVFFSFDVLRKGALGLGALATGFLVGMVIGAGVIARRIAPPRQARALAVAALVAGIAIASAALAINFAFAIAMFMVAGMANGVQNVSMRSIIHARVAEHLRGRVFSAYAGATTGAQLAATALAAPIVAAAGARAALLVGGIGGVIVGTVGLAWMVALRRSPKLEPAPA